MASNRKYIEVKGYWVYSIKIPSNNKYYIGVSQTQCFKRWCKTYYKGTALEPYFSEWDNLIKTVIKDGLTETEALKMEDDLIQALRFIDLCVNSNRSGLIYLSDAYIKEYYENNKEKILKRNKQYYEDNKEKIQEQKKQYYEKNKESINEKRRQRYQKKKLKQQQNNILKLNK